MISIADIVDKNAWHPGFVAAAGIELKDEKRFVSEEVDMPEMWSSVSIVMSEKKVHCTDKGGRWRKRP